MPSPSRKARSSAALLGRSSSAGAALKRGDLKISDPIPIPRVSGDAFDSTYANERLDYASTKLYNQLDGTWPRKSASPAAHVRTQSNGAVISAKSDDINPWKSRISMGPSISLSSAPSKGSLSRRKNSGFRVMIRRMFGSKRHRETLSPAPGLRAQSHPTNLGLTSTDASSRLGRIPSQPVSNLTRSSALGSNFPFQELDSHHRHHDDFMAEPSHYQRRNTLPSVTLSEHEAQLLRANLGEAGARAKVRPARSRDDKAAIQFKRRSRSADALREEARHQLSPIQWRRRSREIEYWRNSAIENPIPDFFGQLQATHASMESTGQPSSSFAPSPSSIHKSVSRESLKQFDFGSLARAKLGNDSAATLEQRVTTLEVKFIDHEYAIAGLQGHKTATAAVSSKPKRRSVHDLFQDPRPSSNSRSSSDQGRTFLSSAAESPLQAETLDSPARANRSSNAETLRPLTTIGPQPTTSSFLGTPTADFVTREQFDALREVVVSEQTARRQLEAKVAQLESQLENLRAMTMAAQAPVPYPTPSPESRHAIPMVLRKKPARHSLGFSRTRVGSDETSRFSTTDAGDSDTDDGYMDVYETPRETQESHFGFEGPRRSPLGSMI